MPSLTAQTVYPSSPPPTQEPVPFPPAPAGEAAPPPPPPDAEMIPLQTGRTEPAQQAAPPPDQEIIPLQTGRSEPVPTTPVAEPAAPAEEAPPPTIRGLGAQTEQTKADVGAGLGQIGGGDILGGLGTIKDAAGDQMAAQGGDLFPWRRMLTDAIAQEALDGDPAADAPWQDRLKDAVLTGTGDSDPFVRFIEEDPERTQKLMTEGYTSQGGTYTEPGTAALWEAWQDPHSGVQRAAADIFYDPTSALGLAAGAVGGAAKAPKAVQVAGRAVDAATSLGLSEAIPLATRGLGTGLKKVGILAPTARQTAIDTAEEAGIAAGAAAATRREAGLVGETLQSVEKRGDVTTLRDPSGSLTDITYQTGKNGSGERVITGIIDDPANPAAVRPVTPGDFDQILEHQRNLGWDDFGTVREDSYRTMFDWRDPATGSKQSYLEALDPEIGTPIPGSVDAWNRYRGMMAQRMRLMDSVNPDLPVLRSLLADWDSKNTHFLDIAGISASERRLSAIGKIADEAGLSANPLAQQMLTEARARLKTGPIDFVGQEVLDKRYNLGPISRASQQALKAQVAFDPTDFYRQIGTLNAKGMQHLLSTIPAVANTRGSRALALSSRYRNFEQLMAQRFAQYGESEAMAAGQWLTKQLPKGKNATADAVVEALNHSGLLPRTVTTPQDAIAAINALAKAGRAPWPVLPAGVTPTMTSSLSAKASAPPPGIYTDPIEQMVGAPLSKDALDALNVEHTFGGVTKKAGQTVIEEQDKLERLRALAQTAQTRTLTAKEEDTLKRGLAGLHEYAEFNNLKTGKKLTGADLAGWDDAQVDRVAARRAQRFVEQAQGLVDAAGKAIDPAYYRGLAGKALKVYDDFAGYRRTMSLYSTTRGPAYVLMQAIGNGLTLGIARPAALRRYTPVTANDIRKWSTKAEGELINPPPRAVAFRDAIGVGRDPSLGIGGRDQLGAKTAFERSTNPVVRGLGKIAAPQIVKDVADSFDTALRHALYLTPMEPAYTALKRDLPTNIERAVAEIATNTGVPLGIGRTQIDTALANLPSQFSGVQLREAILDASGGRAAQNYTERFRAADRAARDYINEVRTLDKAALEEVNRVGFDFKETRADAVLSRAFMFHYWMSRASVLYLNEAARNPWQAQLWARAMNAGKRKMEETGAPTWQRDLQSFLSTPAGYTGFWNPAYLLGTYLFMQDSDPASPTSDLTGLGRALTDTPLIRDTMLNPLLQGAIYVLGAGGPDFKPPDLLGTGKWTGDINAWLDKANLDVKTFYAEQGKPKDVPNLDSRSLLTWAAQQVNNRGWDTSFFGLEPAKPYDANRNTQANLSYFIMDDIIAQNPQLDYTTEEGAAEIASMVEEALANPSGELYQSALRKNVDMQMGSSGTGAAPVDLLTGAARNILPFGVSWSVDSRDAAGRRKNLDQQTALDTAMSEMIYDTPEGMAFWNSANAMWNTGTPKQKKINELYQGIQQGTVDVVLDGREWTKEELAALPAEDRDTLAKYWMDLNGYWGERQAMFDASDAIRAENPDMANMSALKDYVASYPTGAQGFIEDTRRLNPNYNRYVEGLQSALDAGKITEEEFLDKATNSVAYTAIAGIKTSRFDYDPIVTGRGRVAGLAEGETLAGWQQEQGTGEHVETGSAFNEKKDTLAKELETFTQIQQRLNQLDAYYGQPAGTTARRYASELAQGSKYISRDIYDTLKADGWSTGDINPGSDGQLGWYLKWALNQMPGTDLSPDAYWSQSNTAWRKKEVDRINAGIVSVDSADAGTVTDAISSIATNLPQSAIVRAPTTLRSEPGGAGRIEIPAGLPVAPGQVARGSDGTTWIYVTTGFSTDGGWVLAEELQAA